MAETELLNSIQKGTAKLGELIEADYPVHLFTLNVGDIKTQNDDNDPSRLKRAKTTITVRQPSENSIFAAIVEFRGRTFVLSRVEGNYSMDDLVKRLRIEYSKRYRKETLNFDRVLKGGKVGHYILTDPAHFVDFLHYVKTVELEIFSQLGEHALPKWIEWLTKKSQERKVSPTPNPDP